MLLLSPCGRQSNGPLPPRCPRAYPQNLWMCYLTQQKRLCRCEWIMDREVWRLSWITRVDLVPSHESLKAGNLSQLRSERDVTKEEWLEQWCCWLWRCRKAPWAKECGQPPEAGRDQETDSPLEPPERSAALLAPRFAAVRPMSDFWVAQL